MSAQEASEADRRRMLVWDACPSCGGSGLELNYYGEPDACSECKGDCVVRARDAKGRFVGNLKDPYQ